MRAAEAKGRQVDWQELRRWFPFACVGRGESSFRACLLLVVVACVLPSVVVASTLIVMAYQDGRAALFERGRIASGSMLRAVDGALAQAIASLQILATSPAFAAGDLPAVDKQAREALRHQSGSNLVLSDPRGQQLMNTLLASGLPLPRHGNPALLRAVLASGMPQVSDVFVGGVTQRPLVAVEVPVRFGTRGLHGLAMGFFPERLSAMLGQLNPEPDWVVSVIDRTGTIVARTHLPERFVGEKASPALLQAMSRSSDGMIDGATLEGTAVLAAFSRSRTTGWTVAVGIPKQALLSRLQHWVLWLTVSTVLLLGLGVFAASMIARRLGDAVAALLPMAEALGRGDAVQAQALSVREAGLVAQAMHEASGLIRRRTDERDLAARRTHEAQEAARRLEHEAHHDSLTGLANRAMFLDVLACRMRECGDRGSELTVFFVDVDDFKPVNDRYGHQVGDELLRSFAARLEGGVREADLVARLGGDEFAVLLDGLDATQATPVAQSLIARLSQPYSIQGLDIHVSASVGVAGYPGDGCDAAGVLEAADVAMYAAKHGGKGGFALSGHARFEARG